MVRTGAGGEVVVAGAPPVPPKWARTDRRKALPVEPEEIEQTTFPTVRRGYDPKAVDRFLSLVASYYREAKRTPPPPPRPPAPPPPPPPPPLTYGETLGDEVASIVDFAAQAAEELRAKVEREAHAILTAAAEEAAETTQLAMKQLEMANQVTAAAEQEADAIRAAARYDANRLGQEAREAAARLEQDAQEKASQLERAANANVAAVLAEARLRYEQLRAAQQKAVDRLAGVEAMIRTAREQTGAGEEPPSVEELLGDIAAAGSPDPRVSPQAGSPAAGEPAPDEPDSTGAGTRRSARRPSEAEAPRRSTPLHVDRSTKEVGRRGRAAT